MVRAIVPGINAIVPMVGAVVHGIGATVPTIKDTVPSIKAIVPSIKAIIPSINALVPSCKGNVPMAKAFVPRISAKFHKIEAKPFELKLKLFNLKPQTRNLKPPSMQLLDGKKLAEELKLEIKGEVEQLIAKGHRAPHLAAILVGDDGGSLTYVGHKVKACEQVGFKSMLLHFDASITEHKLLDEVKKLNHNNDIDGFIVQLPLPKHINSEKVIMAVDPKKDVDGFHPVNVGRVSLGLPAFVSATPLGITKILERYNISTEGKHAVVIGRSNIVGRPMSILLSSQAKTGNATVTVCHSKTQNLKEICLQADIIVAALGKPGFLRGDMVKQGAVVIDVGTTRVPDTTTKAGWRLKGDALFDEVAPRCSAITPVPGGVGPMTVVSLLLNTLKAAKHEI